MYSNAEFDSNQTLFEFICNNVDLVVVSKDVGNAGLMLFLAGYIIDELFKKTEEFEQTITLGKYFSRICDEDEYHPFESEKTIELIIDFGEHKTTTDMTPQGTTWYPKLYDKFIKEMQKLLCEKDNIITIASLTKFFEIAMKEEEIDFDKCKNLEKTLTSECCCCHMMENVYKLECSRETREHSVCVDCLKNLICKRKFKCPYCRKKIILEL